MTQFIDLADKKAYRQAWQSGYEKTGNSNWHAGYTWNSKAQRFDPQSSRPGSATPRQDPYASSTPYKKPPSQPQVGGWPTPKTGDSGSDYSAWSPQQPSTKQAASTAPQQGVGGQVQDLFRQYNFTPPAGFIDDLIGRLGSGQNRQPASVSPAVASPLVPSAQNFMPAQAYSNSMNAWAMPKQDLLAWGGQAANQPWGPNYGNMPDSMRPQPYAVDYNNPFGQSPAQIAQGRDGFIQSVLNQQAQQFTGTYLGDGDPGPNFGRQPYVISDLMQNAQSLASDGWQNPFAQTQPTVAPPNMAPSTQASPQASSPAQVPPARPAATPRRRESSTPVVPYHQRKDPAIFDSRGARRGVQPSNLERAEQELQKARERLAALSQAYETGGVAAYQSAAGRGRDWLLSANAQRALNNDEEFASDWRDQLRDQQSPGEYASSQAKQRYLDNYKPSGPRDRPQAPRNLPVRQADIDYWQNSLKDRGLPLGGKDRMGFQDFYSQYAESRGIDPYRDETSREQAERDLAVQREQVQRAEQQRDRSLRRQEQLDLAERLRANRPFSRYRGRRSWGG